MCSKTAHGERNAGLDVLRGIAIAFVLVYHLPQGDAFGGLGIIGVEIFLTLSGYLVAAMIFERFDGIRTAGALKSFLVNRWIRTLPLYGLALTVTIMLTSATDPAQLPDVRPFLVFAQTLMDGGKASHGNWFGSSWSLALEEWFYLILPMAIWLGRRRPCTEVIVKLSILLIVVAIAGRATRYYSDPSLPLDDMYRRVTLLRLDTFCYGVLMYLAVSRWPATVTRLRYGLFLTGLAILGASALLTEAPVIGDGFAKVVMLSAISIGTALLIPFFRAFDIRSMAGRTAARFLSTRTYALYLSHGFVYAGFAMAIAPVSLATALPVLGLSLVLADLVYRGIERPILAWRPSSERAARTGLPAGASMVAV